MDDIKDRLALVESKNSGKGKEQEAQIAFAKAFLAAQVAMGAATRAKANSHFKSKYATLEDVIEEVKGPLNSNGLAFKQYIQGIRAVPEQVPGAPPPTSQIFVVTVVTHIEHTSGGGTMSVTEMPLKDPSNPQAVGSSITYAKRYALQSLCGLPTEDDDGNAASAPSKADKERETLKARFSSAKSREDLEALANDVNMSSLDSVAKERFMIAISNKIGGLK